MPDAHHETEPGTPAGSQLRWVLVTAVGLGAATLVVVAVALVVGATPWVSLGWSDPGTLVRLLTPLVRLVAEGAAVVAVGALVFAVMFTVPDRASAGSGTRSDTTAGTLAPRGWAAAQTAGRWAGLWALAALVETVLSLASTSGGLGPLLAGRASVTGILAALEAGETPLGWLVSAVLAGLVAVTARLVLRWTSATAVLVLAVGALLPPLATGHASSQAGHDLATPALWVHVPAAVVWMGALVALVRPGWRTGRGAAPTADLARRYTWLATTCWWLLVASGLVTAGVLLGSPAALVTTSYGLLTLAVVVLTLVLGELGRRCRRRTLDVPRPVALVAGELVLLATAVGLSVAATVLVPPSWQQPTTAQQTLLGFDLAGPPTLARLVLDWRPDVVLAPAAVLGAVLYLRGVRRVRVEGGVWPAGRTAAWLAGCAVAVVATSSGIGRYAGAMISLHMTVHMLLSTAVPVLLVLGAPLILARRVAAPPGPLPGPVGWLDLLASSWPARLACRPVPVLVAFVAAPFVLYATPVFDAAVRYRWAELLIDVVMLGLGLAFARVTVGLDGPSAAWVRVAVLLVAMPGGALFATWLAATDTVVGDGAAGANMYSSLALPWTVHDLLGDQRVAAGVALAIGEVVLVAAIAVVLRRWDREQRHAPAPVLRPDRTPADV